MLKQFTYCPPAAW